MKALAVGFVVVYALTLVSVGWWIVAALDRRRLFDGVERTAIAFGVGGLILHFAVMAVGSFRLDAVSMGWVGIALVVAAIPGWRALPWADTAAAVGGGIDAARRDPLLAVLWLVLIVIALSSMLQGLAPPNDYDSLMYHLALPKYDIEAGRISYPARWHILPYFPALLENHARFGLALAGEAAVQMQSGMFGLMAAALAAGLARRLGRGIAVQVLAAAMFLAIRVVIWQMASLEVDVVLAAYAIGALVVYIAWQEEGSLGAMILFGLMIGGGLNTKYHGFPVAASFAPAMIWHLLARRRSIVQLAAGPLVAVAAILPLMARNFSMTGNPLFPLYNDVFNPGGATFLKGSAAQYGTGRGILDFLTAPWTMSVAPMQFYDGMILGAPYLLALAPLVLLDRRRHAILGTVAGTVLVYYALWFTIMSQQVRFLLPVFPALAALSAVGIAAAWSELRSARLRIAFVAMAAVLAANQMLFVGIYAAIRLPVALGMMSEDAYHAHTPTLGGAFYKTCTYIRDRLKPGERYLSIIMPQSPYCPLIGAIWAERFDDEADDILKGKPLAELDAKTFLEKLESANIRFLIVQRSGENRRNDTGAATPVEIDIALSRWGRFLAPIIPSLKPLSVGRFSAVYDGAAVIEALKKYYDNGARM